MQCCKIVTQTLYICGYDACLCLLGTSWTDCHMHHRAHVSATSSHTAEGRSPGINKHELGQLLNTNPVLTVEHMSKQRNNTLSVLNPRPAPVSMDLHCVLKTVPTLNMSRFLQKHRTLFNYHLTGINKHLISIKQRILEI